MPDFYWTAEKGILKEKNRKCYFITPFYENFLWNVYTAVIQRRVDGLFVCSEGNVKVIQLLGFDIFRSSKTFLKRNKRKAVFFVIP